MWKIYVNCESSYKKSGVTTKKVLIDRTLFLFKKIYKTLEIKLFKKKTTTNILIKKNNRIYRI